MRKWLLLIPILLLAALPLRAQTFVPIVNGTVTVDASSVGTGRPASFKVVLTANVTASIINGVGGQPVSILFLQDSVGSRTVTFASNIINPCTITATASTPTGCSFTFDAGNNQWVGTGGGGSSGGGTPTPGVFNSSFDPPLFQCYSAASGCQSSFSATGTGTAIDLRANPIDTQSLSWRLSGSVTGTITDTIPYANGDLHAANASWVYQTGTFNVSSNVAYGSSATSLAYRSDGVNTASEFAQETMVITVGSITQNNGPCVRVQTVSYSGYCIQVATDRFRILLWNAGSATVLGQFDASAPVTGDVVKITSSGTTLTAYKNGVVIGTATDATWSTGQTGMFSNGSANSNGASNFQSGQLPTCNIQLDSSQDNVTWTLGGAIPAQDCTAATSAQATAVANFVRVNLTALSSSLTLTVQYAGRLAPAVTSGVSQVSNGQWVNAGEVVWTQVTIHAAQTFSVSTSTRIVQMNGVTSNVVTTVASCAGSADQGNGFGYVVPSSGWLQAVTTQVNTGNFPQGTYYINQYLMATMPSGGSSTACSNAFSNYNAKPTLLSSGAVGSFYPVSFVGTSAVPQAPWAIPGYTTTLTQTNPAAGAEFSFTAPTSSRVCVQSVSFTLASGSTAVNPTLVFTINGSKIAYTTTTQQALTTTQNYTFSPGAVAESVTTGGTIFHIIPFNNGQLACFNSGLSTATISSVTTGLNGTTQYSNISFLVQIQQDNN